MIVENRIDSGKGNILNQRSTLDFSGNKNHNLMNDYNYNLIKEYEYEIIPNNKLINEGNVK
jgi:hypothetical protein